MFIFQIPISQDPNNVMPRIVPPAGGVPGPGPPTSAPPGPTSDPWVPAERIMQQQQAGIRMGQQRRNTIIGQRMIALLGPDLTANPDGSYSRPHDTGRYYYQENGSIFYTGGQITLPDRTPQARGPQTLVYRYRRINGERQCVEEWDESLLHRTPLGGTFVFNRLGLVPDGTNTFILPGEGNTGKYFLQPDGTIFYEGGTRNGQQAPPQTYINGSWDLTRRTTIAGTSNFCSAAFRLMHNGVIRCPCGDPVHMLANGNIINTNATGTVAGITENGRYRRLTPEEIARPEIQTAIQTILRVRREMGLPGACIDD